MASLANAIVDRAVDSTVNNINPAAMIPKSMVSFIDTEKINLKQKIIIPFEPQPPPLHSSQEIFDELQSNLFLNDIEGLILSNLAPIFNFGKKI